MVAEKPQAAYPTEIEGDLLDVKNGIICHQVNCRRVAGAGIAMQIRQKWPDWYRVFRTVSPELGLVTYYKVSPDLIIASLYAQDGFGIGEQHTDYAAFRKCLRNIRRFAKDMKVYLPVGIGCGLAGGDWIVVSRIISTTLPGAILVRLPRRRRSPY